MKLRMGERRIRWPAEKALELTGPATDRPLCFSGLSRVSRLRSEVV
jgi:hypothetical protein